MSRNYNNKIQHKQEPTLANVIGDDDRVRITPTTSYPWSAIVKLHIAAGGYYTFGTGALIDKNHVLTAGHCVYSHLHGGWADSIKVVPGEDNGNEPFGYAWAINLRCYVDWIVYADEQHDFAVITLDRDIGLQTGWMGLYTSLPSSSIYKNELNTAGYPYDLDNGANMYWNHANGRKANEYKHWYYLDTNGGQSGSPIWIYDGTNRYILSVHAYGDDGLGSNHGTRIDRNKFDCIDNWLTADETLTNKPDLASLSNSFANFNTTIVGAGLTDFELECKVRNLGTVSSGQLTVSYYASVDTTYSKDDYLIGMDVISSLSPTSSTDSRWSGTFPEEIPSGEYYIGWIIDVDNTIDEFNENNNWNFIWSRRLLVDATPPTNPTTCVQLNGTTESDVWQDSINNPYFSWSGASDSHTNVAGYYYYWGNEPNGTSTSFTTSPSYDPPGINNGTYYLRVCTEDIVGNKASWTTLYVFKFEKEFNNTNDNPIDDPVDDPGSENPDNPDNDPGDDTDDDFPDKYNKSYDSIMNNALFIGIFLMSSLICVLLFCIFRNLLKI